MTMESDISVLFSGGPDSTLATLRALDQAPRVHLLTFHHHLMGAVYRHRKVVEELGRIFGEERVIAHEDSTDKLFHRFYLTGMSCKME